MVIFVSFESFAHLLLRTQSRISVRYAYGMREVVKSVENF